MANQNNSFKLSSQSNDFNDRLNSVFGALPEIKSLDETNERSENKDSSSKVISTNRSSSDNKGRNSHPYQHHHNRRFQNRRPAKAPDHVMHPEKYTKYSLKHDGTSNISAGLTGDALNKKIALDFITNIKQQKEKGQEIESMESKDTDLNPSFKFSRNKDQDEKVKETSKSSSLFQSSHGAKARVMGTFEFGCRQTKEKTNKKIKQLSSGLSSNIKLSYYEDEEEEDEG